MCGGEKYFRSLSLNKFLKGCWKNFLKRKRILVNVFAAFLFFLHQKGKKKSSYFLLNIDV